MDNFGSSFKKLMALKKNTESQNNRVSIDYTLAERRPSTEKVNIYSTSRLKNLPLMAKSTLTPPIIEEETYRSK
jgi:hypothetical protein